MNDPLLWGLIAADAVLLVIAACCVWSAWHEEEEEDEVFVAQPSPGPFLDEPDPSEVSEAEELEYEASARYRQAREDWARDTDEGLDAPIVRKDDRSVHAPIMGPDAGRTLRETDEIRRMNNEAWVSQNEQWTAEREARGEID